VQVFRLCRRMHASKALDGRGGLLVSGRWHHEGVPVVYTSATPSLAALEYLVHADSDLLPGDLVSVTVEIPPRVKIERVRIEDLPRGWNAVPAGKASRDLGTRWLEEARTPVLALPSVVVPQETNYLINPRHPGSAACAVSGVSRFALDPRILRKSSSKGGAG